MMMMMMILLLLLLLPAAATVNNDADEVAVDPEKTRIKSNPSSEMC